MKLYAAKSTYSDGVQLFTEKPRMCAYLDKVSGLPVVFYNGGGLLTTIYNCRGLFPKLDIASGSNSILELEETEDGYIIRKAQP